MAVTGRNITDICNALEQGLIGQTVQASQIQVTFNAAEDDQDVGIGNYEAVDGALQVRLLGGSSGNAITAGDGNSLAQWEVAHQLSLEFCYAVGAVRGEVLRTDKRVILEKTIDLVHAICHPAQLGQPQYGLERWSYQPATRHAKSTGMYLQTIRLEIREFWRVTA